MKAARVLAGVVIWLVALIPALTGVGLLGFVLVPLVRSHFSFAEVTSFHISMGGAEFEPSAWETLGLAFGSLTLGAMLAAVGYAVGFKGQNRLESQAD